MKKIINKEKFNAFISYCAELGSILWYFAIIMCLVSYKAYGIMFICLLGALSSIYVIYNKK